MSDEATTPGPVQPPAGTEYDFAHLRQSRWAVRAVQVICVLLCLVYGCGFFWQAMHVDVDGSRFRDRPGAWAHLAGHALRSLVAGVVALTLRGYLRDSRAVTEGDRHQLGPMLESLANFWSVLAFGLLLLMMQGLWAIRGVGPPPLPATHEFRSVPAEDAEVAVGFHLAETEPCEGLVEKGPPDWTEKVYLHPEPFLKNDAIERTRVVQEDQDRSGIEIRFTRAAQPRMFKTTDEHQGKVIAIVVDGEVVFAASIVDPLRETAYVSGGSMTADRAERLARNLSGRR